MENRGQAVENRRQEVEKRGQEVESRRQRARGMRKEEKVVTCMVSSSEAGLTCLANGWRLPAR